VTLILVPAVYAVIESWRLSLRPMLELKQPKAFCNLLVGTENIIGFVGRTAVTLKLRPEFSEAQRTKNGSVRHG
jgi:hypothetical protein